LDSGVGALETRLKLSDKLVSPEIGRAIWKPCELADTSFAAKAGPANKRLQTTNPHTFFPTLRALFFTFSSSFEVPKHR
jgi:hypothetical protein